ncbi:MAG: hypothetical protein K6E33_04675, partial [Lachnospiraceae bacterium]|nr:hypothetical protein [Lachnospiraceae bacterium]
YEISVSDLTNTDSASAQKEKCDVNANLRTLSETSPLTLRSGNYEIDIRDGFSEETLISVLKIMKNV